MTAPLLRVRNLTKDYGRVRALDNVSFDVDPGEIVAVLGANGAGKTTTFKCILGITRFQGEVEVEGLSVAAAGKRARARMGYLPQSPDIADGDTCADLLAFLAELRGVEPRRISQCLDAVGLRGQARTPVAQLSGGMKQRLALAAALLADPPLLLLDEPTSSLDVQNQAQFQELIREMRRGGKTALIATHYARRLGGLADRAIVLDGGRLVFAGKVADLPGVSAKRSFVVNLNGTSLDSFREALAGIGIPADDIEPVEPGWDEAVAASVGPGRRGRE